MVFGRKTRKLLPTPPIPATLSKDEKYKLIDFATSRQAAFYRSFNFLVGEYVKWHQRGSQAENKLGTIMEFGVWNGDSMVMIWEALQRVKRRMDIDWRMIGFDSFEGLPASSDERDAHRLIGEGSFTSSGKQAVIDRLFERKLPRNSFELIEGWYNNVLTDALKDELGRPAVSFVNIDVDYYSSTMLVLDWVEDLLFDGSIVYFDDILFYNGNPNKGQLRAIREFNESRTTSGLHAASRFDPCGRVYVYWREDPVEQSEALQF